MKVKIIDPAHACCGQELEGGIIYLDYYHRGGRPDLYEVRSPEGKTYCLLTHQIDEAHYEAQEISEEVERLGANAGDTVLIIRPGSGGCNRDLIGRHPMSSRRLMVQIMWSSIIMLPSDFAQMFNSYSKRSWKRRINPNENDNDLGNFCPSTVRKGGTVNDLPSLRQSVP